MAVAEINCEDARELLKRMAPSALDLPKAGARRWIYRGQGGADWKLIPSAFRPKTLFPSSAGLVTVAEYAHLITPVLEASAKALPGHWDLPKSFPREQSQVALEADVLTLFFHGVDAAGLPLPEDSQALREQFAPLGGIQAGTTLGGSSVNFLTEWPPLGVRSILALAQHHRVPTRLLDWSHDCRVAAFFAAKQSLEEKTKALAVFALDREQAIADSFLASVGKHFQPHVEPPSQLSLRLVTAPAASNANLLAQRGLFTLLEHTAKKNADLESLSSGLAEARRPLDVSHDTHLRKFILPTSEARALLKLLALDGVTAASVFPGYSGVVESLNDTAQWQEEWHEPAE